MAEIVYILCAATSLLCAVLLARGYRQSGTRFLLWCSLCFALLTVNNVLLFIDLIIYPQTSVAFAGITFAVLRSGCALVGLALLVWGLIWDTTR